LRSHESSIGKKLSLTQQAYLQITRKATNLTNTKKATKDKSATKRPHHNQRN